MRTSRDASARIELFEKRLCLSADFAFPDVLSFNPVKVEEGTLVVTGTTKTDDFVITREDEVANPGPERHAIVHLGRGGVDDVESITRGDATGRPIDVPSLEGESFLRVRTPDVDYFVLTSEVGRIHVDVGAGDDRVRLGRNVRLPGVIIGARGDDHLEGGSGAETISGGAGDDTLVGGARGTVANVFDPGRGKDVIHGTSPSDRFLPDRDGTQLIVRIASITRNGDDVIFEIERVHNDVFLLGELPE